MTFISYAQNYEDVLLWRALGHIKNGFYIDAGANDPVMHSVTKAFYDAGWRGINIEPMPAYHQQFMEQRPRDVNLAVAAGAQEGSITLYDVPDMNGWASTDPAVAAAHRADGHEVVETAVPLRTLAAICAEHVQGDVHFLKIDVEGFEGEVLRGMDFVRWRPWVLVVEATLPGSRESNHAAWENQITGQRYQFTYFDGLNRYYVADEHQELLAAFGVQPNVFDDFITHHLDKAWTANAAARELCLNLEARANSADAATADALAEAAAHFKKFEGASARAHQAIEEKLDADAEIETLRHALAAAQTSNQQTILWARDLETNLNNTLASASWRVTRPLRSVRHKIGVIRSGGLPRAIVRRITASETARRLLIPVMRRFPALGDLVSQKLANVRQSAVEAAPEDIQVPEELRGLPSAARSVLQDIKNTRHRVHNS
ncbi:MAG: FkbM family methyltransferase [Pseudomonadota bacterium]